ncbi:MAG: COX15/CtaA family protein [Planctomycetota bacterium]|jgi:hypothetical protein|nr:COX15/CtaA family protein [Planctomycetota bacterium]MDP6941284.1 COX15/CtaA family protein [Planctomycetota bacterium]
MSSNSFHPWVYRLSVAAIFVAVVMTSGLGGAVTSTDVGMAYPTWPDINGWSLFNFFYGEIAAEFGAGASIEHTHRQAGTLIGLLVIALVFACFLGKNVPAHWKRLSVLILLLVVAQGLLGAVRVLDNDQLVAIIHAIGAQLCVVALVAMAKLSSQAWVKDSTSPINPVTTRLRLWTRTGIWVLFLNLISAASLRHKAGAFMGHFILALVASGILLGVIRLSLTAFRDHARIPKAGKRLAQLLGVQLGLGVGTWACLFGPLLGYFATEQMRFLAQTSFATAHLVVGVGVLAQLVALDMEARHRSKPS